ncbi:hypothetical protein HIM_03845 [Hirsutella minnesotensis 3608]|uniref:Uncharacterized protein n=1 Tax=Hirsutella minnesotensis 3608 TaxID=1043627 RepID=A0A0F7ZVP4_9HYPO|nr:hypothetical protein HIM_03845 [Hirsutella minnesotensis 3608]
MTRTRNAAKAVKQVGIEVPIPSSSRHGKHDAPGSSRELRSRSVPLGGRVSMQEAGSGDTRLRSETKVASTGTNASHKVSNKRRGATPSQPSPKRAHMFKGALSSLPEPIDEEEEEKDEGGEEEEEEEDPETAPRDPTFYDSNNSRSRGLADTARPSVDPYEVPESENGSHSEPPNESQRPSGPVRLPKGTQNSQMKEAGRQVRQSHRHQAEKPTREPAAMAKQLDKATQTSARRPSQQSRNVDAQTRERELEELRQFDADYDPEDDCPDTNWEDFSYHESFNVVLDIPEPEQAIDHVRVESSALPQIVKLAGKHGWAGDANYASGLLPSDEETEATWWNYQQPLLGTRQCRALFICILRLARLFKNMPKGPDVEQQVDYLRNHRMVAAKHLGFINATVFHIVISVEQAETEGSKDGPISQRGGVKALHKTLVPFLVLCLQEAFLAGASDSQRPGDFAICMLQPMVLICQWIKNLRRAIRQRPPDAGSGRVIKPGLGARALEKMEENRRRLVTCVDELEARLQAAIETLEYRANEHIRRQEAMERDMRIRAKREEEARSRHEAHLARLVRHLGSIRRRFRSSSRAAHGSGYYKRHGWDEREDEALLEEVRSVQHPRLRRLLVLIPGRSQRELERRISELRTMSWQYFTDRNMEPPAWCYDDGGRERLKQAQ